MIFEELLELLFLAVCVVIRGGSSTQVLKSQEFSRVFKQSSSLVVKVLTIHPLILLADSATVVVELYLSVPFFFSISQTVGASRLYGGKDGLSSCLLFGVGFYIFYSDASSVYVLS